MFLTVLNTVTMLELVAYLISLLIVQQSDITNATDSKMQFKSNYKLKKIHSRGLGLKKNEQ